MLYQLSHIRNARGDDSNRSAAADNAIDGSCSRSPHRDGATTPLGSRHGIAELGRSGRCHPGTSAALIGRTQVDPQHEETVLHGALGVTDDGEVHEIGVRLRDERLPFLARHRRQ
eukprot:gene15330-32471_t